MPKAPWKLLLVYDEHNRMLYKVHARTQSAEYGSQKLQKIYWRSRSRKPLVLEFS